jgi:hypothetical protein
MECDTFNFTITRNSMDNMLYMNTNERTIMDTCYEILKKYHIFCYLNIMCDLVQKPYDIKIIWFLLNVDEIIFNNKVFLC